MNTFNNPFSPAPTPKPVKMLILVTALISIVSALLDGIIYQLWHAAGPQYYLSLSLEGLSRLFLWQPFTYMVVHPGFSGISMGFLLALFFNMLILYFAGSILCNRFGARTLLTMYISSGVVAGIISSLLMAQTGSPFILAGCTPSIFALLVVWSMAYPDMQLLLFFILPVHIKWLVLSLVGLHFLVDLSHLNFIHFFSLISGMAAGYLYALIALDLRSPFPTLYAYDEKCKYFIKRYILSFLYRTDTSGSKIYDFETGRALDDDDNFMDEMLQKISAEGEHSLSKKEKARMRAISERRRSTKT